MSLHPGGVVNRLSLEEGPGLKYSRIIGEYMLFPVFNGFQYLQILVSTRVAGDHWMAVHRIVNLKKSKTLNCS